MSPNYIQYKSKKSVIRDIITYQLLVRLNLINTVAIQMCEFFSIQTSGDFLAITITHNRQYIWNW